jgi:hypothetical protein
LVDVKNALAHLLFAMLHSETVITKREPSQHAAGAASASAAQPP